VRDKEKREMERRGIGGEMNRLLRETKEVVGSYESTFRSSFRARQCERVSLCLYFLIFVFSVFILSLINPLRFGYWQKKRRAGGLPYQAFTIRTFFAKMRSGLASAEELGTQ